MEGTICVVRNSPLKFHRYDVEIFQLYFHLCFIWSHGHRFWELRFTIAQLSEMCVHVVYRTRGCSVFFRNQKCRYQNGSSCSHVHLQLCSDVGHSGLLCLILVCIVWTYIHASLRYCIAGNFWGRKLSGILRFCESFLCEIWACGIFWQHQRAICESFLHNFLFFH